MLKASLIVSLASAATSVLGFITQILFARFFGVGAETDAYLIGATVPLMAGMLVVGAAQAILVPLWASHNADTLKDRQGQLLLSVLFLAAFGFVFASQYLAFLYGGSVTSEVLALSRPIARLGWCSVLVLTLSTIFVASLQSEGRFVISSVASLFPPAIACACTYFLGAQFSTGSLAIGFLFGNIIQLVFLLAWTRRPFSIGWKWPAHRELNVWLLVAASLLSFGTFGFSDGFWASKLELGAVTILGYAQRIVVAAGSILVTGLYTVLLPELSRLHAEELKDDFSKRLKTSCRNVLLISTLAALLIWILRVEILTLTLQGGRFTVQQTLVLSEILAPYMIGLPAMCVSVVLFRALYAAHLLKESAFIGTSTAVMYFILAGLFSLVGGVQGIAWSFALTWFLTLFALDRTFKVKHATDAGLSPKFLIQICCCASGGLVPALLFKYLKVIPPTSLLGLIFSPLLSVMIGLMGYYVLSLLVLPEDQRQELLRVVTRIKSVLVKGFGQRLE